MNLLPQRFFFKFIYLYYELSFIQFLFLNSSIPNFLDLPLQINVSTVDNPADASFFESYEAAHSLHDLSKAIAEVLKTILYY